MRQAIDTAPRDGKTVIIEDDASGTYDVAHWSAKAGKWVGENGEPSKITPTHWYPRPRDQYFLQEDNISPRRFSALSIAVPLIAVGLLAAGLAGLYEVFDPESHLPSQDAHRTDLLAPQQLAEVDPARVRSVPQVKQAVETPLPEARQTLTARQRTEVLANELAEDRRVVEGLNRQLEAEAANSAQLLGQQRQNDTAARQELTAITAQHRQALDEERARNAALASELAMVQREIEAQAAETRKAVEASARLKLEAAEGAQSIEQEREKAAALAQEAAAARAELAASTAQHRQALDEERARNAVLASELATAQREIEAKAAQHKASDETGRLKQADAESSAQSLEQERQRMTVLVQEAAAARRELTASTEQHHQALEEERTRRAALWSELATAQRQIEVQAAQLRQAREETEQLKQATESATAELRQLLQHERDRNEAMARDLESARYTVGARIAPGPAASSPTSTAVPSAEVAAMAPAATEAQGRPEAARLIARASALLGQGDIGAARTVLERAAETGSAQASFMLAETYDPGVLTAWGTYGTRGEVTKARELYEKAHAGGIQEAWNRFNALRQ
jgi:hypothetical protein